MDFHGWEPNLGYWDRNPVHNPEDQPESYVGLQVLSLSMQTILHPGLQKIIRVQLSQNKNNLTDFHNDDQLK